MAKTPAQTPSQESGCRPQDDFHIKSARAPRRIDQPAMPPPPTPGVRGRRENKPETMARARPKKKSQRTPMHIRVAPIASRANSTINFTAGFFMCLFRHNEED